MLSQVSQNIIFHAFFTKTKAGVAPSSAPTVSIERKGSGSLIVSGGTTTAGLITGHYTYTLAAASDATADDYLAVFHTSDATVDFQDVPSLWVVGNSFTQLEVGGKTPGTSGGGLPVLDGNGNVPSSVNEYGGGTAEVDSTGLPRVGTVHNFVLGNNPGGVDGTFVGQGVVAAADTAGSNIANATNLATANASLGTLTSRITAARAGYLDNLNVGGAVASHADIAALNASASRTMTLACVAQMEPGETYTVEMHTYNRATGASSNADSTPTLTAVGAVSGSLAANLTGPTNPSTAIYQWTYTVPATPTLEQIRFAGSATVAGFADSLACYTQTVDEATVVFTATDQTHLTSIFNKLPAGSIGDATATTQTAIKAKTDLIATNAADSPEVVTALGTIGTLLTRVTGPVMLAASYVAPDNADIAAIVAVTNKVNTMLATSGLNWAYTVDALKNGPAGGGGGGTGRTINEVQRIIFEKQS